MTAWAWNARAATVAPNGAEFGAAFAGYAGSPYFAATDAVAWAGNLGVSVQCSLPSARVDHTVYIPAGTLPGWSNDHHLTILDPVRGRTTDLGGVSVSGSSYTAVGGVSFPYGAAQEPAPGNANAARFPLLAGLVTPQEIAAGVISHSLVCSANNLGPAPCPYPANTSVGYKDTGHCTLGTWLSLPATAQLGEGANTLESLLFAALQSYGMFIRDTGSTLSIRGLDTVNQGGIADWHAQGILLNAAYANSIALTSAIPWASLQVLEPPTP